jgi:hypothetical protein
MTPLGQVPLQSEGLKNRGEDQISLGSDEAFNYVCKRSTDVTLPTLAAFFLKFFLSFTFRPAYSNEPARR